MDAVGSRPSADLGRLRDDLRDHLLGSIMPFWMAHAMQQNGARHTAATKGDEGRHAGTRSHEHRRVDRTLINEMPQRTGYLKDASDPGVLNLAGKPPAIHYGDAEIEGLSFGKGNHGVIPLDPIHPEA